MKYPALLSLALVSFTAIASAQVTHLGAWNTANITYSDNLSPTVQDFNAGRAPQFASVSSPGFDAWAFSGFGIQRSYLSMAPTSNSLYAGGTLAVFDDRLVISRAGLAGRRGIALVSYTVTGSYGIAGSADFANLEVTSRLVTIGSTTAFTVDSFNRNSAGTGTGVDFLGVRQFAFVNYIFGTPFDLELDIQSNGMVNTFGGGRGSLFVDLSHTVLWGGIEDVYATDDLGNPIGSLLTDWSVTSDSLTDYSAPFPAGSVAVPEPATYGGIAMGLLGLGAFLRRRQRTHAAPAAR